MLSALAMEVIQEDELKFKHPFSMLLTGARRTGKTHFTKTLLRKATDFITPQIDKVFWFAPSRQNDLFDEMGSYEIGDSITFVKDLPSEDLIDFVHEKAGVGRKLLVFDDLMEEASRRKDVKNLFTRGRHEDLSVIFLAQNTFHQGGHFREISLNTDYFVIFKNVRDGSTINYLANQMNSRDFLPRAYKHATQDAYSHLLLDMRSDTDERLRVRAKVFDDYPMLYIKGSK